MYIQYRCTCTCTCTTQIHLTLRESTALNKVLSTGPNIAWIAIADILYLYVYATWTWFIMLAVLSVVTMVTVFPLVICCTLTRSTRYAVVVHRMYIKPINAPSVYSLVLV